MDDDDMLPDHLRPGLVIIFCGTAAGTASAMCKAYYAGPGNLFWPTLHETGLTDRLLGPEEFTLLNEYGSGLTDVAKKTSGSDDSLRKEDFCVGSFRERMAKPKLIAFNGKKAASVVLQKPTRAIRYGLQEQRFLESRVFVLPSTSGTARKYWDKAHCVDLARLAKAEDAEP
jgi:TDG/mug DNA glycosylase family protein